MLKKINFKKHLNIFLKKFKTQNQTEIVYCGPAELIFAPLPLPCSGVICLGCNVL